jgi:hypothetical protein
LDTESDLSELDSDDESEDSDHVLGTHTKKKSTRIDEEDGDIIIDVDKVLSILKSFQQNTILKVEHYKQRIYEKENVGAALDSNSESEMDSDDYEDSEHVDMPMDEYAVCTELFYFCLSLTLCFIYLDEDERRASRNNNS